MKPETLNFIQKLTEADTKTLSQKVLKTAEEVGELAKVVLPFETAHATTHRFGTREKILEEVADVFLANISIGLDIGFTYEEIMEEVERKAVKWAELQVRHNAANYPVPYEIHITVTNTVTNRQSFKDACKSLNVKPIVLDLQMGPNCVEDVMTSSKHFGDNATAYFEMVRISKGLKALGFEVIREKIETVPWHPSAPSIQYGNFMPEKSYFECHLGVFVPESERYQSDVDTLTNIAKMTGAHKSKNVFKVVEGGSIQMITLRDYVSPREIFEDKVADLRNKLDECGFKVDSHITEFAVYDTNTAHDNKWTGDGK